MRRGEAKKTELSPLYGGVVTPEERLRLGLALTSGDLGAEIGLLRVLIERAVRDGSDIDTVSLAISRLATMLRIQHTLTGDAAKSIDDALARVLAEIGSQMGGP